MKTIKQEEFDFDIKKVEFVDDCKKIRKIAMSQGLEVTLHQAETIWKNWSKKFNAEWLIIRFNLDESKSDVITAINLYIKDNFIEKK